MGPLARLAQAPARGTRHAFDHARRPDRPRGSRAAGQCGPRGRREHAQAGRTPRVRAPGRAHAQCADDDVRRAQGPAPGAGVRARRNIRALARRRCGLPRVRHHGRRPRGPVRAGKGDVAATGLTVTRGRQALVPVRPGRSASRSRSCAAATTSSPRISASSPRSTRSAWSPTAAAPSRCTCSSSRATPCRTGTRSRAPRRRRCCAPCGSSRSTAPSPIRTSWRSASATPRRCRARCTSRASSASRGRCRRPGSRRHALAPALSPLPRLVRRGGAQARPAGRAARHAGLSGIALEPPRAQPDRCARHHDADRPDRPRGRDRRPPQAAPSHLRGRTLHRVHEAALRRCRGGARPHVHGARGVQYRLRPLARRPGAGKAQGSGSASLARRQARATAAIRPGLRSRPETGLHARPRAGALRPADPRIPARPGERDPPSGRAGRSPAAGEP